METLTAGYVCVEQNKVMSYADYDKYFLLEAINDQVGHLTVSHHHRP